MKKYILLLVAVACSFMSIQAMNLREAFNALSNLPYVTTVDNDDVTVSVNKVKDNGIMKVAKAIHLDREQIKTTGNATFAVLNQIPLSYMINGGNNNLVAAFIYSTRNESGTNDMLIVTMSGEQGDLTFIYVTDLDDVEKLRLQEAKLTMKESWLSIIPSQRDGFIGAIRINCD